MANSTQPLRKQSKIAPGTPNSCLFSLTSKPSIAVGPTGESLLLPKMAYIKGATIEEYKPKTVRLNT